MFKCSVDHQMVGWYSGSRTYFLKKSYNFMIRGENLKTFVSECFEAYHPGTTSQNFRTTVDRDFDYSAKLFGLMSWVKKCFNVLSFTKWWDDLVALNIFLVENFFYMNSKIKKSKIKYDLKNQKLTNFLHNTPQNWNRLKSTK